MGWSCARIAARYGLFEDRAQGVLDVWKWEVATAKPGYLQHIPVRSNTTIAGIVTCHGHRNEDPAPAELKPGSAKLARTDWFRLLRAFEPQ
jgi:hypothetical protein